MKRIIRVGLYVVLAAVILSEIRIVWVALTDRARFNSVFRGAVGAIYYVTVVTSACAGAKAVAVWLRQNWAIWGQRNYWRVVDHSCRDCRRSPRFSDRYFLRYCRRFDFFSAFAGALPREGNRADVLTRASLRRLRNQYSRSRR